MTPQLQSTWDQITSFWFPTLSVIHYYPTNDRGGYESVVVESAVWSGMLIRSIEERRTLLRLSREGGTVFTALWQDGHLEAMTITSTGKELQSTVLLFKKPEQ